MKAFGFAALAIAITLLFGSGLELRACDSKNSSKQSSKASDLKDANREKAQAAIKAFLAKLKSDDPDEYAKLMALKESDPSSYRSELKELMRKKSLGASDSLSSGAKSYSGSKSSSKSGLGGRVDLRR